jgi:hypothetical protein
MELRQTVRRVVRGHIVTVRGVAAATAMGALLVVGAPHVFGQDDSNPFLLRGDRGELVHVLPPPAAIRAPHDAEPIFAAPSTTATVYKASYGVGKLIDHGGPEVSNAGFWAIYWNNSVAGSTAASPAYGTIEGQIQAFVQRFPDNANYDQSTTDDYEIIQQYGSQATIANTLPYLGVTVDSQATRASISDAQIQAYLAGLFTQGVTASSATIYGLYFPSGMQVTMGSSASCSSFCGYHNHFTYNGLQIKYAVFPYLDCSGCTLSGFTVGDMLTIVASHEIRETATDSTLKAWYDRLGYEADDKCAWHHLYQTANGSFWVQPEFSNGGTITASGFTTTYPGTGCVVP